MAFCTLMDDLHVHLAQRGWKDVRPREWLLAACRARQREHVAAPLGMTKQAASELVEAMMTEATCGDAITSRTREQTAQARRQGHAAAHDRRVDYREIEAKVGRDPQRPRRVLRDLHDGGLRAIRPTW
jgi:hypothetical protein